MRTWIWGSRSSVGHIAGVLRDGRLQQRRRNSRLVQSQIPYPCKAPGVGAGPDCAALVSSVDERIRDHNIALAGFVGAGLGAAALAATAYLWKPSPGGDKSPAMTPIVTRQATGLVLTWRH